MKNVNGKEDTAFTVQYDFCMPEKFKLNYIGEDGAEHLAFVIHRSSIGAIERIMAFLIEKYAGAFPFWLSPVQVKIIPVRANHNEYSKQVFKLLKENNIRAEFDDADLNLGTKVRNVKNNKIPYWIVVGDKEINIKKVTLESRDNGNLGQLDVSEILTRFKDEISNRI